jgi:hypothetical protein
MWTSVLDPWPFDKHPGPRNRTAGLRIRIPDPVLSWVAFKMQTRNRFFFQRLFCFFLMKVNLHLSSTITSYPEDTICMNQVLFSFFCLLMEESRAGSVQIITGLDSEPCYEPNLFCFEKPFPGPDSKRNVLFWYRYLFMLDIATVISCCCRWLTFLVVRNDMCSISLDPTCDWALWRPPWASSRRTLHQSSRQAF